MLHNSVNKERTTNKGGFLSSVCCSLIEGGVCILRAPSGEQKHLLISLPTSLLARMLFGYGGCILLWMLYLQSRTRNALWLCIWGEMKLVIQFSSHHTRLLDSVESTPYAFLLLAGHSSPHSSFYQDTIGDEHPFLVHVHLHQV